MLIFPKKLKFRPVRLVEMSYYGHPMDTLMYGIALGNAYLKDTSMLPPSLFIRQTTTTGIIHDRCYPMLLMIDINNKDNKKGINKAIMPTPSTLNPKIGRKVFQTGAATT